MARHRLYILSGKGHTALAEWDPKIAAEVKTAEEMFGQLQKQGMHLFDATNPQETKNELQAFDPKVKEVVGFNQLEGG